MSGTLELVAGRLLLWTAQVPSSKNTEPYSSPIFWFQDCECFLKLIVSSEAEYKIFIPNKSNKCLKPFKITSYIQHSDDPHFREENLRDTTSFIGKRHNFAQDKGKVKKFCFFFHEDATLRLDHRKDNLSGLERLSSDFSKLLSGDSNYDVTLKCGDITMKAHRNVLSCRSKVFSAMFQSDMEEDHTGHVDVHGIHSDAFKSFIAYLYTGKLQELTPENAKRLYEASELHGVEDLMKICSYFFTKDLTLENACEMLVFADAHSDEHFKEKIIQFMFDKDVPLRDDLWNAFCDGHSKLAFQVLNRFYKSQKSKINVPSS